MHLLTRVRSLVLACTVVACAFAAPAPHPWPSQPQFLPVTAERVAQLPAKERAAWTAYLERSAQFAAKLPSVRAAFVTPDIIRIEGPGIPSKHSRAASLVEPKEWYATEAARTIADHIVAAQSGAGGWTKSNDYALAQQVPHPGPADVWSSGTFDNNSTTLEVWFLARVIAATPDAHRSAGWRESVAKAIDFTLAAQYPNGGLPQIYPLAGGYHDAITYNDDAMVQALEMLRDVANGKPGLDFLPARIRQEAGAAVERGVQCILATQLKGADGQPAVWCQQYDAITMQPCAARNFEPPALCTNESASLVRFLMSIEHPTPQIAHTIKTGAAWLDRAALHDIAWTRQNGGHLSEKAGAGPIWARMYEIGTDRPIFGDRDRTVHYDANELSSERRSGYAWFGTWPASALAEYKTWSTRAAP